MALPAAPLNVGVLVGLAIPNFRSREMNELLTGHQLEVGFRIRMTQHDQASDVWFSLAAMVLLAAAVARSRAKIIRL